MDENKLKHIIEGALFAAGKTLSINQMLELFSEEEQPAREQIRAVLKELADDYADRALELKEVASGYRFQVRENLSEWVTRLWAERPSRYSRALLETLALVAYRQPITRGEIEDIRGVSVSSSIMKTLQEREWVKVVGHRDVPGKPAMYGTTRTFLDYFNLKSLDQLPTLAEIRDIDSINAELNLNIPGVPENDADAEQRDEESAAESETTAEAANDESEDNAGAEMSDSAEDREAQADTDSQQSVSDDDSGSDNVVPLTRNT
jgi:segregation and condensation protein B